MTGGCEHSSAPAGLAWCTVQGRGTLTCAALTVGGSCAGEWGALGLALGLAWVWCQACFRNCIHGAPVRARWLHDLVLGGSASNPYPPSAPFLPTPAAAAPAWPAACPHHPPASSAHLPCLRTHLPPQAPAPHVRRPAAGVRGAEGPGARGSGTPAQWAGKRAAAAAAGVGSSAGMGHPGAARVGHP